MIRAGVEDLQRITARGKREGQPHGALPPVPQAAQLSMLLLLLLQGVESKHRTVFAHKQRLAEHLKKVYGTSKACWEAAVTAKTQPARERQLRDTSRIGLPIAKLGRFAEQALGDTNASLAGLGVPDVQKALGILVSRISHHVGQELSLGQHSRAGSRTSPVQHPPSPILGGLLVASVAGDIGTQGSVTQEQVRAMRVGVSIGTTKPRIEDQETTAARQVRKTLKAMAKHLPPQEADL